MSIDLLRERFGRQFGREPVFVVRAPGRVNLIGEHTDYNDGFVFPAAIEYAVTIAGAPRDDQVVRAYSLTYDEASIFDLASVSHAEDAPWSNYVRGVASVLRDTGRVLGGMDVAIEGTVPIASGLSSSAAMEVASCLAFETAGGFAVDPVQRALLSQRAEREFVGVQCGIMDQFISSLGQRDHALFIDTRTLGYEAVPLPEQGVALVIGDTRKQRGLVDSEYNTRRRECEEAVAILGRLLPGVRALRDVSPEQLAAHIDRLPAAVARRARHVVTEDARVLESVRALKSGDVATFGRLMNESHVSLRDDYQVSCRELDVMVEAAWSVEGVYGARMTGAGFGGCTVSLVQASAVDRFQAEVGRQYHEGTGLEPAFYVTRAADGARRLM